MENGTPDKYNTKTLNVVIKLLLVTILMVIISIGLLYYFKIDYYLPIALLVLLIPLTSQLDAALNERRRLSRLMMMKKRAQDINESEEECLRRLND
jgi:O-antigen/teichoic acid export membrane protein